MLDDCICKSNSTEMDSLLCVLTFPNQTFRNQTFRNQTYQNPTFRNGTFWELDILRIEILKPKVSKPDISKLSISDRNICALRHFETKWWGFLTWERQTVTFMSSLEIFHNRLLIRPFRKINILKYGQKNGIKTIFNYFHLLNAGHFRE